MNAKELIARRIAMELKDGDIVNLGIGLPTLVANYLPDNVDITLQSENGFLGLTAHDPQNDNPNVVNAGGQPCGIKAGGAFFDSAFSFALIRGGHVDACVLGGLEVDQQANLANWMVPGKMVPGMGGAMDLVTGAKKVIMGMEHCAKSGSSKILKQCSLPLTAVKKVKMIVTELAVFEFEQDKLILKEHAPNVDLATIRAKTEADFIVADDFKPMVISQKGLSHD
ncbi:3-oxoacid CoA-transferase subunit B [Rodentibacter pneumotropicus]|uniref:3-oxoacid CoA-transferase subunit B n=1 Tax=Rodentibacter pneumotropicus TaxID=758 RepID=UPI000988DC87|nr:3-oxoacid CoA-transferase subunit B [Rodentibacter pneumotropicus]NBH75166.1 CoA transferase subunit B [Rodentibacter pneumotropicus]OOF60643.1 succinyl-CoA--3-ketoacid-CoA transferase [Rodentibacter pneumotropicus]THA01826.1 CoA transferase subunit B [Rodentibacter pneumotropicus]THA05121.1 CoA transferase subunit B [Rodentibacter pneumotropicus]THA13720.1 CoA transferase subunit B [Rodentibacter pneumotropicus]